MMIMLKPTTEDDYEAYYKVRSCPGDIYWNGYESKPDKEGFRVGFLKRLGDSRFEEPEDRRNYLIQLKTDEEIIESIGFIQLIKRIDGTEISYTVVEEYQGHGYATKALELGIKLAKKFNQKIYVQIRDDNKASQKVAEKCGFVAMDSYELNEYPKAGLIKLRKYILE